MGFVTKVARRIYPAHDELAIFAMAVGIISLAVFDQEFGILLVRGANLFFVEVTIQAFQSSWWEGLRQLFGAFVLSVLVLTSLIVSLYLPFTSRRFDLLIVFVVMAHSIMICAANFVSAQEDSTGISAIIALATLVWMTGYFACLRYRVLHDIVTHRQASRREGVVAGVLAVSVILVCSVILNWHWAHSYAFAAVSSIAVTQIFVREKMTSAEQVSELSSEDKS